jgi:hypothetical protein
MTATAKLVASLVITAGTVLLVRHGVTALNPAIPKDMPRNAYFAQSGYNLQRNEPLGDWIACRLDAEQNADLCRVTDNHGVVIYQGEFLPLHGSQPVPADQLKIAANDDPGSLWVRGPAEGGPVPVIPLVNGKILVPRDDSDALADRWAKNSDELNRIEARSH